MGYELNVVLVRTLYPSNLGATARAMANMGASRLVLVDPRCEPTASKAKMAAASAQDMLEKMTVYDAWADFYAAEGSGLRLALTRRQGKRREPRDLAEYLAYAASEGALHQPLYLIFGPEDNGLEAGDLELVHSCVQLPTFGSFGSLNLSQAVLLSLFIVQNRSRGRHRTDTDADADADADIAEVTPAKAKPLYFPDDTIRAWIQAMGFDLNARKASAYLTLKKLLLRNLPADEDLHVLEAVLRQNIRKLSLAAKNIGDHEADVTVE
jgi:TrmH family RNA methyltransferase